jgi:hypothetical protein
VTATEAASNEGGGLLDCTRVALTGLALTAVVWIPILLNWFPPEPWDYVLVFVAWIGLPWGTALGALLSLARQLPLFGPRSKRERVYLAAQGVASLLVSGFVAYGGLALLATAFTHHAVWPW